MTTYRQLVYLTLDCLKISVDDAYFTEDHIIFLLNKCRSLLLKQTYKDIRKEMPDSNYQSISLTFEDWPKINQGEYIGGNYLKSINEIPYILPIATPRLFTEVPPFEIAYVSRDRIRHVGYNKNLSKMVYATIATDNHLYLKSNNPAFVNIKNNDIPVILTAIFENADKAIELGDREDILDKEFPIEESLVPQLIEMVIKELSGSVYKPEDAMNNSSDDLANLASFIRSNTKSNLQKQIEG